MKSHLLPEACIAVVEPDRQLARILRTSIAEKFPKIKVLTFFDPEDAWQSLSKNQGLEVRQVVTDSFGVKPLRNSLVVKIRKRFPRAYIQLFCDSLRQADALPLYEKRLIHQFTPKGEKHVQHLINEVEKLEKEYERNDVLLLLREYIQKCAQPESPFIQIKNKNYNLFDIYQEIMRRTDLGESMERSWVSLFTRAALLNQGKGEQG